MRFIKGFLTLITALSCFGGWGLPSAQAQDLPDLAGSCRDIPLSPAAPVLEDPHHPCHPWLQAVASRVFSLNGANATVVKLKLFITAKHILLPTNGATLHPRDDYTTAQTPTEILVPDPHHIIGGSTPVATADSASPVLVVGWLYNPSRKTRELVFSVGEVLTHEAATRIIAESDEAHLAYDPATEFVSSAHGQPGMSGSGLFNRHSQYLGPVNRGAKLPTGAVLIRSVRATYIASQNPCLLALGRSFLPE